MGRNKINYDKMLARFPLGTLDRIDSVLVSKETRSDLLRATLERELRRRERAKKPSKKKR